jgi:hypothetical protein
LTFHSLTIERHPSRESAQAPFGAGESYGRLQSLNAFTFPKPLWAFAKEQGLDVSHVDNAWVRVAMDGHVLKQFMAYGDQTERDLEGQIALVDDHESFVVNEEEF